MNVKDLRNATKSVPVAKCKYCGSYKIKRIKDTKYRCTKCESITKL